jgi:hypothetical protein
MVVSADGLYLSFKHPVHEVKTGISIASVLDVKASGGYGVAPRSIVPNVGCTHSTGPPPMSTSP